MTNALMKLLYQQWEIFDEVAYHIEEYQGIVGHTAHHCRAVNRIIMFQAICFIPRWAKWKAPICLKNVSTNRMHEIKIPSFELMAPFKITKRSVC